MWMIELLLCSWLHQSQSQLLHVMLPLHHGYPSKLRVAAVNDPGIYCCNIQKIIENTAWPFLSLPSVGKRATPVIKSDYYPFASL